MALTPGFISELTVGHWLWLPNHGVLNAERAPQPPPEVRDHWDDTSSLEEAQEELAALVEGLRGSQEQGPAGSISSDADAANGTPAAISVCT